MNFLNTISAIDLQDRNFVLRVILTIMAVCIILSFTDSVFAAQNDDVIGDTLCRLAGIAGGSVAKAVATIAIIVLAMSWFAGKISWVTMLITCAGVALIFSAGPLVDFIAGDNAQQCAK